MRPPRVHSVLKADRHGQTVPVGDLLGEPAGGTIGEVVPLRMSEIGVRHSARIGPGVLLPQAENVTTQVAPTHELSPVLISL